MLALLLALSTTPVGFDEPVKDDTKLLEGVWLPTTGEMAGNPFPDELIKQLTLEMKDGKYTVTMPGQNDKGTVKIDPKSTPKSIDIAGQEGPNKGRTILAIYEYKDDVLKVCYDGQGKNRPKEFKTTKEDGFMLITYKRKAK